MFSNNRYETIDSKIVELRTINLTLPVTGTVIMLGFLLYPVPNFSTKSRKAFNYRIAKKQSALQPAVTFEGKFSKNKLQEFTIFDNKKHTQDVLSLRPANVDPLDIFDEVVDTYLEE